MVCGIYRKYFQDPQLKAKEEADERKREAQEALLYQQEQIQGLPQYAINNTPN